MEVPDYWRSVVTLTLNYFPFAAMSSATILSSLNSLSSSNSDLFASTSLLEQSPLSQTAHLQTLLTTLAQISHSLSTYSSNPISDPKHISQLRQYASIQHSVNQVGVRSRISHLCPNPRLDRSIRSTTCIRPQAPHWDSLRRGHSF
jgi:hypothetical protein